MLKKGLKMERARKGTEYLVVTRRGERLTMTAACLEMTQEYMGMKEFKKQALAVMKL